MTPSDLTDFAIEPLSDHVSLVETAADWLHGQWPDSALREETIAMLTGAGKIPNALVAFAAGSPVGVLGFKRHELEGQHRLWINALFVIPEAREAGVATSLVTEAVNASSAFGAEQLYVYTDIPNFYLQLGWELHSHREETGAKVLKLELTANPPLH